MTTNLSPETPVFLESVTSDMEKFLERKDISQEAKRPVQESLQEIKGLVKNATAPNRSQETNNGRNCN